MKPRPFHILLLFTLVPFLLAAAPQQSTNTGLNITGGTIIYTVPPNKVCVGDTLTFNGGAGITLMDDLPASLAWLPVIKLDIHAELGQVSPQQIIHEGDFTYYRFTYKATQPGKETITVTVNDTLASDQESFEVEDQCDYDAFLTDVVYFSADMEGEKFQSISHITGTGTMKRDRQGSQSFQGDGTWHLEEIVLSKPSECVEYYMPPLIMSGPFQLTGLLADNGDTIDVKLNFLPRQGEALRHGDAICVDAEGNTGVGWGYITGGDPALAAKFETTFLSGGGTQSVDMQGGGVDIVESVGDLDYTATLTLIPR